MDFDQTDIGAFLRASVPRRFQDITPYDFEKFIGWLLHQDGYTVEETGYSGDFGADLLARKSGKSTVVQVKRYAPGTPVSVGDINQVIGARTYYQADQALVITTSAFSKSAITIARKADIILWDWERLLRYLKATLAFEDPGPKPFGSDTPVLPDDGEQWFSVSLLRINTEGVLYEGHEAIEVHLELTNLQSENLTIHLDLPVHLSRKSSRQTAAVAWKPHFFFHGILVAEASVELACIFLKEQVEQIRTGERMLIRVHLAGRDTPVMIDTELREKKTGCYIVTFVYGRESEEYRLMTGFRDTFLMRSGIGKSLVRLYYATSPWMLRIAGRHPFPAWILRTTTPVLCRIARYLSGSG